MARSFCPGQDTRFRTVDVFTCNKCGAEEEMFSDELKVRCPNCREWIYKEQMPSCVDWCKAARECVGEEQWQRLKGDDEPKS